MSGSACVLLPWPFVRLVLPPSNALSDLCPLFHARCPTCALSSMRAVRLVPGRPRSPVLSRALTHLGAWRAPNTTSGVKLPRTTPVMAYAQSPALSRALTRLDARRAPNITPGVKLSQTPPRHEPATRTTPVMAYAQSPALSRALTRLDARRAPNVTPGIKLP